MTAHKRPRRGRVDCQRCRRIVQSPSPTPDDVLAVTDAMAHALSTVWLACRDASDNSDARMIELQEMVDRMLTADQRSALLLTIKCLDGVLAHAEEKPCDDAHPDPE